MKPKHMKGEKNVKLLFHQTSPENMVRMLGSSPGSTKFIETWKRSQKGLFGEGIYCADSIEATMRKAQHRGVIFCGEFDLGNVKEVTGACSDSTYEDLQRLGINTLYARKGLKWRDSTGSPRELGNDEYILTSQRQLLRGCWYVMEDNIWRGLIGEPAVKQVLGDSKQLYLQ